MPFLLIRNDITKVCADAIVNTANTHLQQGSGTSRAIYLAAGEELLQRACGRIGRCERGKAVITEGFHLPAKYIIHAVGPVWRGGIFGEKKILYSAYMESMKLAEEWKLESIAFPLISSGNYGYPREKALKVAVSAITDFLMKHDMMIYLVLYDAKSLAVSKKLFSQVEEYIDEHYIEENNEGMPEPARHFRDVPELPQRFRNMPEDSQRIENMPEHTRQPENAPPPCMASMPAPSMERASARLRKPRPVSSKEKTRMLDDIMLHMGESFSQMLLRLIDERGMTDPEAYHKANIDRKLFSKIRTNPNYMPTKKTVLAFAFALELSLDETKDLLRTAGYSLSDCSRFDVIIQFFLEKRIYDIFEINEMLFYYEQPLLGG